MKPFKVGIIGNGFVGEAQSSLFSPVAEIRIYDRNPLKSLNSLKEVCECDIVFICVPTPMFEDGSQDTSYLANVFENITPGPIYIIKSTVIPGTTKFISKIYREFKIVFCPEFLTERTFRLDAVTPSRILIGGPKYLTKKVRRFFEKRLHSRNYIETDSTTAEYVKYMNNTFFATKVSIMNEFRRVAERLGVDWKAAVAGFVADGRVADSHLQVPGPDGKLGYGGTCFPKDINALILLGKELGLPFNTLEGSWKTNLEVRPEQEWKYLEGKAFSKRKI